MLVKVLQWTTVCCFVTLTVLPLLYAIARLESVTGINSVVAVQNFFTTQSSLQALKFTLLEATISTIATVIIGLPIAWCLGRYNWKNIKLLRAILAVPFVTPSIVVAMGFLMLIDVGGPLTAMGIDLRLESGIVGELSNFTNWENPGHFIALITAHVWFNISLVMRFVEPTLSTMDRTWEEQMHFLPAGQNRLSRIRNLWLPIIGPAVLCAATLCFIFSFTSFALVRWLTPNQDTLETMMANSGGSAGIYGYRIDTSEVVLSTSIVQLIILSIAIICATSIQRRHSTIHAVIAESDAKQISSRPNNLAKMIIALGVCFAILPLMLVTIASFRIRNATTGEFTYSSEAWSEAWSGDYSTTAIPNALSNSLIYCLITVTFALPMGWIISSCINRLEQDQKATTAKIVEFAAMIPLALSAVMIGLGILLGLLKWSPGLFGWAIIPAIPHIIITTPFVIRIILPALRSIDSSYHEQAIMLGMSPIKAWWHGKAAFLRAPLVVAGALTMAFSLGEFGASWILVRSGSWDTLSVLIDQLMSQPKFNPLIQPMAMAAATVLMLLTFILFFIAERFRDNGEGSGF